jgi:hypothetical protein
VHDRRIDGEAHVFGNAGGLYKYAMTWWDHKTVSIWSQPTGRALSGPLKRTELALLPSQMTSWANWKAAHPETLALTNSYSQLGFNRQKFDQDFVVGLVLADLSKAYYYEDVAVDGVLNDWIGEFPVLIWAANDDYRSFSRTVGGDTLTFQWVEGVLSDLDTGTTWDVNLGLGLEGPLKGQALQPIPSLTAFDWAWEDFYRNGEIYQP